MYEGSDLRLTDCVWANAGLEVRCWSPADHEVILRRCVIRNPGGVGVNIHGRRSPGEGVEVTILDTVVHGCSDGIVAAGEVATWQIEHRGGRQTIDGRKKLRLVRIEIRDPQGRPVETVLLAASSASIPLQSAVGPFEFLAPRSARQLHVQAIGFRERIVTLDRDEHTIVLQPSSGR